MSPTVLQILVGCCAMQACGIHGSTQKLIEFPASSVDIDRTKHSFNQLEENADRVAASSFPTYALEPFGTLHDSMWFDPTMWRWCP